MQWARDARPGSGFDDAPSQRQQRQLGLVAGGQLLLDVVEVSAHGTRRQAQLGGDVIGCAFVIDLPDLGGTKRLIESGIKTFSLCEFKGD